MVTLSSFIAVLGAVGAAATPRFRNSVSPGYRSADVCPERCSVSGPTIRNWSVYPNFNQIKKCKQTMFYDFSLYDPVDDRAVSHKIHACSSYGPDFDLLPASGVQVASVESVNVEFEMGWRLPGCGLLSARSARMLRRDMEMELQTGLSSSMASLGLSESALKIFQDNLENLNVSTPNLAMQLCGPDYDSTHIFGIMATSRGTFSPIQDAIKSWANATCLSFEGSAKFPGRAMFTAPLLHASHTTTANSTVATKKLHKRAECRTVQVEPGNSCADLAVKCGISGADFTKYNPGNNICSTLKPKQYVCCSKGDLPDFRPKPNKDGSCFTYQVKENDNCDNLAAEYSLTRDDLENFKNTWGWNSCKPLYKDTVMCLSEGDAPFPAPIANACLFQDASQIDTSGYTHINFGFGTLTPAFDVEIGDRLSSYQFGEFKRISGAKKILLFGGWAFSTDAATYQIFRNGVKPANRLTMATKITNFIKKNNLDGVDIDWEYPGAPDLPEFDPGTEEEGPNYLAFLVILKNLLPGKSVSIAAPSSYWYLKQFPIAKITSQVNLTETKQSLAMITKAGVPGEKVIVGVTSYGRSFKMAEAGCYGPNCLFTGDRLNSNAKKGKCTGTVGYIADAEIAEILNEPGRVVKHFVDSSSNSNILVYDDTEWVSYMSTATKKTRTALYSAWGLGGTSDWATDLQKYHDVPPPATRWAMFIELTMSGEDPKTDMTRNGNWTDWTCEHPYIVAPFDHTPSERWKELSGCSIGAQTHCGDLTMDSCGTLDCPAGANGKSSGPAAQFIWNSLATIHLMHKNYHNTLFEVALVVSTKLDDMENTFAPIPQADGTWTLLLIDLITLGTLGAGGPFTPFSRDSLLLHSSNCSPDLEEVIKILRESMANGKLIEGKSEGKRPSKEEIDTTLKNDFRANIQKCFFGYSIPTLWRESKSYAFIIDAGHGCGEKQLSKYITDDTMDATGACVDGKQYYLVYPDGKSKVCKCQIVTDHGLCQTICRNNKFSMLLALDSLTDGNFGDITKEDLIRGSVRTWIQNGKENGGGFAE
ncbi:hypothetical protein EYZ11_012794 [Aspergillus tanneri]|uniref:chitinase n=1 Tax=Aspergillus tanneri TaxID=1220188 RepID=A0A4S3IZB1_9EURO|nr:hypothetical protein EYZ11_012794 [Aspergillus tanneri]